MKHKDINKQANDFANSLMALASQVQSSISQINKEDLKGIGVDINEINKEAEAKVKELKQVMKNYENKIKNL